MFGSHTTRYSDNTSLSHVPKDNDFGEIAFVKRQRFQTTLELRSDRGGACEASAHVHLELLPWQRNQICIHGVHPGMRRQGLNNLDANFDRIRVQSFFLQQPLDDEEMISDLNHVRESGEGGRYALRPRGTRPRSILRPSG